MSERLRKIAEEIEKARKRREQMDAKVKELEEKYREVKNTEIQDIVAKAALSPEELAVMVRMGRLRTHQEEDAFDSAMQGVIDRLDSEKAGVGA